MSEIREDLIPSVAAVRDLFGAAACSCALTDAQGEELTFVAADGAGATEILGVRLPVRRGLAGWAAVSGQPLAVRDVGNDPRFAREVAESTSHVPDVLLVAPASSFTKSTADRAFLTFSLPDCVVRQTPCREQATRFALAGALLC